MAGITRFGMSIDNSLIKKFDTMIIRKGYPNRSKAIQDLIRDKLVEEEWEAGDQETVGTITIVYNHHTRELDHALNGLQHQRSEEHTSELQSPKDLVCRLLL